MKHRKGPYRVHSGVLCCASRGISDLGAVASGVVRTAAVDATFFFLLCVSECSITRSTYKCALVCETNGGSKQPQDNSGDFFENLFVGSN